MKYVYPACFYKEEDGRYSVIVSDLNVATYGNDLLNSIEMVAEAIAGFVIESLEHGDKIPLATEIQSIQLERDDGFVSLVYVDLEDFKANYDNKPVKKTLTLPTWINAAAEKQGINFSATLKEALIEKLSV